MRAARSNPSGTVCKPAVSMTMTKGNSFQTLTMIRVGMTRFLLSSSTSGFSIQPHSMSEPLCQGCRDLRQRLERLEAALAEREQRLRRSEQLAAVGKMAAQITHEIRNPLTSIGLNAELLADDFADGNGEAVKIAQAIVKEVDRLTDITEQYLRFARLPEPRLEPAEVNAMLTSLHGFLQEELGRRGVTVTLALADAIPKVMADDNQLRQVLLNLIRNAAEAMAEQPPSERKLTIGSRLTGTGPQERPGIAVDIIDNGPGIPEAVRNRIAALKAAIPRLPGEFAQAGEVAMDDMHTGRGSVLLIVLVLIGVGYGAEYVFRRLLARGGDPQATIAEGRHAHALQLLTELVSSDADRGAIYTMLGITAPK